MTHPDDATLTRARAEALAHSVLESASLRGLRVSVDGELLRADGSVVRGAFAAGACASNIAIDGKGYASGIQLGEASYFGRRAGRTATGKS